MAQEGQAQCHASFLRQHGGQISQRRRKRLACAL